MPIKSKKVDILLHYEKAFRDDWRFLHRLRVLVISVYLSIYTSLVGWYLLKVTDKSNITIKIRLIVLGLFLTIIASITLSWFGSSINTLKRLLVKIEEALHLFKINYYITGKSIISDKEFNWGQRGRWEYGKTVFAVILIGVLFCMIIYLLQ